MTDHLLHGACCPIAVVPRGYRRPENGLQRVGAAFVDTPEGRNALTGAVALARRAGASLQAITVINPIGWGTMAVPMTTAIAREQQETRRAAEEALGHALEGLEPALAVEPVVIEDSAGPALATLSSQLDVLVCGSRGYGPVKTVLLGSVSHALSRHSRCPLIVLPRASGGALEGLVAEPIRRAQPVPVADGE
jgi:nucleotide-binding universal stress UspA family protein